MNAENTNYNQAVIPTGTPIKPEDPVEKAISTSSTTKRYKRKTRSSTIMLTPKTRRNSLCPCGSGKKFKKCCL